MKEKTFKLRFEDAVFDADDLSTREKLVALAWAHRCNYEDGTINAGRYKTSILNVTTRTGGSDKTTREAMKVLETKGWMKTLDTRPGRVSVYQLIIPTPVVVTEVGNVDLTTGEMDLGCDNLPTPVLTTEVQSNLGSDNRGTPVVTTDDKNSKNITTKNKSKNNTAGVADAPPATLVLVTSKDELLVSVSCASSLSTEEPQADLVTDEEEMTPVVTTEVRFDDIEWDIEGLDTPGFSEGEIRREIDRQSSWRGNTWSKTARVMILEEALRMKQGNTDLETLVKDAGISWIGEEW